MIFWVVIPGLLLFITKIPKKQHNREYCILETLGKNCGSSLKSGEGAGNITHIFIMQVSKHRHQPDLDIMERAIVNEIKTNIQFPFKVSYIHNKRAGVPYAVIAQLNRTKRKNVPNTPNDIDN